MLEELLLELVVGVVWVVVVVLVTTVVLLVVGVVLLVDELELDVWQSLAASVLTVVAPWPRFCTSVVFTVEGSAATLAEKCLEAALAWLQFPAATA